MTIIKTPGYLTNYDYLSIDEDVVELLMKCFLDETYSGATPNTLLKALECYCDLTKNKINYLSLSSRELEKILIGFAGALSSDSFIEVSTAARKRFLRHLIATVNGLAKHIPAINFASKLKDSIDRDMGSLIEAWESIRETLDKDLVKYWSGWETEGRKGTKHFLDLGRLYRAYDKDFACQLHEQISLFFLRQARPRFTEINQLTKFLDQHRDEWPAECFKDPIKISQLFKSFFKWYFLNCYEKKVHLPSAIKSWNGFISNIDEAFIQPGMWAKPFADGLPRPSEKATVGGYHTRLKTTQGGVVVKDRLLTQVPLHVTDDEAIELLFKRINSDISLVHRWAKREAYQLRRSQLGRIHKAKQGNPITLGKMGGKGIEHVDWKDFCATFEENGLITSSVRKRLYGWNISVEELATTFGLPRSNDLFSFMILLVIEHPEITSTFLSEFELFDKRGRLTGFVKFDNHYQLIGYKDRKKKSHSEQRIHLNNRAAVYIRQIIEITAPLRDYLRKNNDDQWRRLFLTCGKGFSKPKAGVVPSFKKGKLTDSPAMKKKLLESFGYFSSLPENELLEFITRLKLSNVRASRGVQIYLKTKSVQEMSKALGHTNYSSDLLSHYLPEPILAFFQTRWIRIFQKALVCEALKDSPYLMEATQFESMQELNDFLQNHAIKDIPSHLSDPENIKATEESEDNSHVMVSVDPGILAALISLEEAVNAAENKTNLCAHAIYWAEVSRLIKSEIGNGSDPLLKKHLEDALPHIKPESMERIIYAAA